MANAERASGGGVPVAGIVLTVPIALVWLVQVGGLDDLNSSDAAGNGLAQAFAAIAIVVLWVLLAVLTLVAGIKGRIACPSVVAAMLLIPASGIASLAALQLLIHPNIAPYRWPLVVPALVPPLIVAFCLWAMLPSLRARIGSGVAIASTWGAIFVLSVAIIPMWQMRGAAVVQASNESAQSAAEFAKLPADSPLWVWTPFLGSRNAVQADAALDRARHLARRQADAEVMLERGDFPLGYLGRFDLDPTPAICEKARALLRARVVPLVQGKPQSRPYADIGLPVADAVAAMSWLVGYGCSCDTEAQAWLSMAEGYRGNDYDLVRLRELRDPKELGRILREDPAHFSMLTPQAHLKAWLKFSNDKQYAEQALAGARKLDHRNADAVGMLRDSEFVAWAVLEHITELDLDATPGLCAGALTWLRHDIAKTYRPRPDDPRPYRELLGRLGQGYHFTALKWLAVHGCDVDTDLSGAEALIRAYQPSPERDAMLASLAQLHRK